MTIFLVYLSLSLVLCLFYSYLIVSVIQTWKSLPVWNVSSDFQATTFVSILIPARNEENNIAACLQSILNNHYPKALLEILVINDHSNDRTVEIVRHWQAQNGQIHLLQLADFVQDKSLNSYKKKALEIGIAHAHGELIITTDADCIATPHWLELMVSLYQTQRPKCIAAPVNFHQEQNLLERFQSLDYAGTMLLTGAGIHARTMRLSNGANLAYPKAIFEEMQGFSGIHQLASGDDMLLVQKIAARYPDGILFLKNPAATILTKAKPDWRSFLQQRIRWATKSTAYREWRITLVLALVFLLCCNILISFLLVPIFGLVMVLLFLVQFTVKTFFDYQLLNEACRFFNRKDLMRSFLPAQLLHILYIVIIGFAGNFIKRYEWKGRKVT